MARCINCIWHVHVMQRQLQTVQISTCRAAHRQSAASCLTYNVAWIIAGPRRPLQPKAWPALGCGDSLTGCWLARTSAELLAAEPECCTTASCAGCCTRACPITPHMCAALSRAWAALSCDGPLTGCWLCGTAGASLLAFTGRLCTPTCMQLLFQVLDVRHLSPTWHVCCCAAQSTGCPQLWRLAQRLLLAARHS